MEGSSGLAKYHKSAPISPYYGLVASPTELLFMLKVKLKSGDQYAFPYACLNSMKYDLSTGITLTFTEHRLVIIGSKLETLFEKLVSHQVVHIAESDSPFEIEHEKNLFVKSITVTRF